MPLSATSRLVRGGKAVETTYWHYRKSKAGIKLFKHGKTFVYPKKTVPQPPNVADQAFKKIQ